MSFYGKVDLHMHSTVSDGTDSPEELAALVKEKGIKIFSVTDHDAIAAASRVRAVLKDGDPAFIPGAEFSARDDMGKYHILAYGYDPEGASIKALAEKCHDLRVKKVRGRMDFIDREYGFRFSEEDRESIFALDNPGKPHIANMMIKYGYVKTKEDAIKNYINNAWLKLSHPEPPEIIEAILSSGGIPVLAHPFYGDGDQLLFPDDMDERLRHLIPMGLKGVEAFYSGFATRQIKQMIGFAEKYGLYVTAGSDYHGKNKPTISLGDTNFDPELTAPEGMKEFFNAVL